MVFGAEVYILLEDQLHKLISVNQAQISFARREASRLLQEPAQRDE